MSVKPIIPSIESNNKKNMPRTNLKPQSVASYTPSSTSVSTAKSVSFTGLNPIVSLMDFIDAGGYAASFIIQDGIGFIAPRVGKGLLRGGEEKKDENGNVILDKNGEPKRNLNWAYARKEGIREVVTGPSAFLIPWGMLALINKYCGSGNNVKLNYIDGFQKPFVNYVNNNLSNVVSGTADKHAFYQSIFENVIENSVNGQLPDAEKMSVDEIKAKASEFVDKQLRIEAVKADKSLKKKERAAKLKEIGSVEDDFMKLLKGKVGGTVNEMAALYSSSSGKVKAGGIDELLKAMNDYFGDAVNNTKKALKDNASAEQIEKAIKSFTNKRMGSRVLTNLGIFGTVAMFYTQIPKLYNWGLKENPALAKGNASQNNDSSDVSNSTKKDVTFTGMGSFLEKTGSNFFNGKISKGISDIFELNGPIISGTAMPVLLYGFCIPPRLFQAQDKYDYKEIFVRDMTAFTTLLFGAKALARLFSDGFTKLTGLALNNKNMEGRNVFQKVLDYLNPHDTRHAVLSSKQLNSKYTNVHEYKNGVSGFMDFIEGSGGNVKKAFARDSKVKEAVENILREISGKTYKEATALDIKNALKTAASEGKLTEFYNLFKGDNGLLRAAKTCNSTFGFLSTLVLVPGLIIGLTDICQKMTEKRIAEENAAKNKAQPTLSPLKATNTPTMAGFISQGVK